MKDIYRMNLHEQIFLPNNNSNIEILRVAGGWVYSYYTEEKSTTSVFIPYHNEFLE